MQFARPIGKQTVMTRDDLLSLTCISGPHPLAIYIFSSERSEIDYGKVPPH